MLFENMGITYYGLVNGHDIYELIHAINRAKQHEGPVLIHAITRKGMGYKNAEKNPEKFHGIGPFDRQSGELLAKKTKKTYTDVFADSLVALAKNNKKIVAITAAMPSGTGLKSFKKYYPKRFFDVGIAEEHAVTFAAGLAAQECIRYLRYILLFYKEDMTRFSMMCVYRSYQCFSVLIVPVL